MHPSREGREKSLYFECYATMPMFADAHISSLGYLWYHLPFAVSDMYRAAPIRALFASTGYPNLCASNSVPLTHSYRKKSGSRQGYSPGRTAGM